jgi:hypothetical protein
VHATEFKRMNLDGEMSVHSYRHWRPSSPDLVVVDAESIDTAPGCSNVGRIPLVVAASSQPRRCIGSVECSKTAFTSSQRFLHVTCEILCYWGV